MIKFIDAVNPKLGCYRWYFEHDNTEQTLYVGCAGKKGNQVLPGTTLARGVSEANPRCVSSDKGKTLDTDFIVGIFLEILSNDGVECFWEHIGDDPKEENKFLDKYKPILQNNGLKKCDINSKFKLKESVGYWITTKEKVQEAKTRIEEMLNHQ